MPTQEKPGPLGYILAVLAIAGMALVVAALGTNMWIKIPGSDSVAKTEAKLLAGSNMSIAVLNQVWPTFQTQYDMMAGQRTQLMGQLTSAAASLNSLMQAAAGGGSTVARKRRNADASTASPEATTDGSPVGMLQAVIEQATAGVTMIATNMAKLQALNATRNAIEPMKKLNLHAGFFQLCAFDGVGMECGSASQFRDSALDEPCEPDYVNPNPTIPTVDSILTKTRLCNANGLAKAAQGSLSFFGAVMFAALGISLIPTVLTMAVVFKPQKRGALFGGIVIGWLFLICGIVVIAMTALYMVKIVGGYHTQGMAGTRTGFSWILGIVGGVIYCLAGVGSFLIRPSTEVAPKE